MLRLWQVNGVIRSFTPLQKAMMDALDVSSDNFTDEDISKGCKWSAEIEYEGKKYFAEVDCKGGQLPDNPTMDNVLDLIDNLNVIAVQNLKAIQLGA